MHSTGVFGILLPNSGAVKNGTPAAVTLHNDL